MAFLARECGWDKDFVADHLTVPQIRAYYEVIQKQKLREAQLQGIVTMHAMGAAFGTIKVDSFKKFLNGLVGETKSAATTISELKKMGLPVEER